MQKIQDDTQIQVEYYDGKGNHTTTFADCRVKFNQENPDWFANFTHELERDGYSNTRFATYRVKDTTSL